MRCTTSIFTSKPPAISDLAMILFAYKRAVVVARQANGTKEGHSGLDMQTALTMHGLCLLEMRACISVSTCSSSKKPRADLASSRCDPEPAAPPETLLRASIMRPGNPGRDFDASRGASGPSIPLVYHL
jgi:hypothetical protein